MTMTRIKKADYYKVRAYMELTGASVTVDGGAWIIDAPEGRGMFSTTAELLEYIGHELAEIRSAHIMEGSFAEYRAACKAAGLEV